MSDYDNPGKNKSRTLVLSKFPRPCQNVLLVTSPEIIDIEEGLGLRFGYKYLGTFTRETRGTIVQSDRANLDIIAQKVARLKKPMPFKLIHSLIQDVVFEEQYDAAWWDTCHALTAHVLHAMSMFLRTQQNCEFWATFTCRGSPKKEACREMLAGLAIPNFYFETYPGTSAMYLFGGTWISQPSPTYSSHVI